MSLRENPLRQNWFLLPILLAGTFLRWSALGAMNDMLHYDEAYNGLDALSLLHHPRLTPFFPGNFGREAGWIYYLVPFVAAFGSQPLGLRLAATMVGVLTLAAAYRLGDVLLGRRAATWATAALAVFYWPMHVNYLALRANLLPLFGALAFATLLQARRTNKPRQWALGGFLVGLLVYTYYSAYFWILYALILLAQWIVVEPQKRRGGLLALCAILVVCLPMGLYAYAHPEEAATRIKQVGRFNPSDIKANLGLWARAWFQQGDVNAEFNLPGRPILDPALGILFLIGVSAMSFSCQRRWASLWVLGLSFFSILPSLLSTQAPHFLRGIGLTLPIALVAGIGALTIERGTSRWLKPRFALALPLSLLMITGMVSYRDFHIRWLRHPEVPIFMESHINQAINFIKSHGPDDLPVYFSPFTLSHPVLAFRASDLVPRQIGAFDSHYCMVIPYGPAIYFSLTLYEPDFEEKFSHWADLTVLERRPMPTSADTMYTIFQATTHATFLKGGEVAVFGDAIQMRLLSPISPTFHAGQIITVTLALRALHTIDRNYSVFIHLYGIPTPYEGGIMWSQGDSQACATYPSCLWKTNEAIVQSFVLELPVNLPPGTYIVAAGIYESPAGPRLPITWPKPQPHDFIELQKIQVE